MNPSPTTITAISCWKVFVPFVHQVEWSAGTRPGITRLVVKVETADGTIGIGETICLLEFIEPVLRKTVIPLAIGEDACDIERLLRKTEGAGYYHHKRAVTMARAAVEMACWDIVGKQAGMPLHRLWGGKYRAQVPIIGYIQSADPAVAAREAADFASRGFGTLKLKLGMGEALDIELVRAVRDGAGPSTRIRGDANGAWTIGTAKRQLRKLEPFDLEYVEQPLPLEDLQGHAHLRKNTCIPIALDEAAYTLQDVHAIIAAEAADVVVIDPHEAGGLIQARKQAALCEAAGIPVTLHSGGECGVSMAAYLHFAASVPNLSLAIDTQYPNLSADIIPERFDWSCGWMEPVTTKPGLGVDLNESAVARLQSDVIPNPYLDPRRPDWFGTKPAY
ncbi:MAG: mandelate racemase/muconate lactonizing enzyme family protein [Akkermansiaceae bacterium]|nr:mandelate racemase/muconate lactonizing enzyme family protein [Akkermansiaceae bacterium]